MDAARELAQLLERERQLLRRAREHLGGASRIGLDSRLRHPQRQGERDEPLLRAVVEVPLEAPALGRLGLDDARARAA